MATVDVTYPADGVGGGNRIDISFEGLRRFTDFLDATMTARWWSTAVPVSAKFVLNSRKKRPRKNC